MCVLNTNETVSSHQVSTFFSRFISFYYSFIQRNTPAPAASKQITQFRAHGDSELLSITMTLHPICMFLCCTTTPTTPTTTNCAAAADKDASHRSTFVPHPHHTHAARAQQNHSHSAVPARSICHAAAAAAAANQLASHSHSTNTHTPPHTLARGPAHAENASKKIEMKLREHDSICQRNQYDSRISSTHALTTLCSDARLRCLRRTNQPPTHTQ